MQPAPRSLCAGLLTVAAFTLVPVAEGKPLAPSASTRPLCAVGQAFRYLGRTTREIATSVGIDQWRADAYPDRMCACFVSGVLRAAGCAAVAPNVTIYPVDIERELLRVGWRYVPLAQSRHGDVALFDLPGSVLGHVELVARRDRRALTLIGSNNLHGLALPQQVSLDRRPLEQCQLMRFLTPPVAAPGHAR
jgi:hypothetical protein